MTNQGELQASIREVTETTNDYNGDWHALFDFYNITATNDFNGRLIEWLQTVLNSSETDLDGLKQEYAESLGFYNWNSINTILPQLVGLAAWYDTSSNDYLTLDGSAITQFKDRAGNGNHTAVQSTSANQAELIQDAQNGRQVARFDGDDYYLLPSGLYDIPNGNNTIFVVSRLGLSAAGVTNYLINMTGTGGMFLGQSGGGFGSYRNSSGSAVLKFGNTFTNFGITYGARDGVNQYFNYAEGTATTNTNASSVSDISVGSIGALDDSTFGYTGDICEILIYDRYLSTPEVELVNTYLRNKWDTVS